MAEKTVEAKNGSRLAKIVVALESRKYNFREERYAFRQTIDTCKNSEYIYIYI
jgi:hypothetical protein